MLEISIVKDEKPFLGFKYNKFSKMEIDDFKKINGNSTEALFKSLSLRLAIRNEFLYLIDTDTNETVAIGGVIREEKLRGYVYLKFNENYHNHPYAIRFHRIFRNYLDRWSKNYFIHTISYDIPYINRHHLTLGFKIDNSKNYLKNLDKNDTQTPTNFWIYKPTVSKTNKNRRIT
jgi:hypothetical protein